MSETERSCEITELKVVPKRLLDVLDDDVITNMFKEVDNDMKYLFIWQYLTKSLLKDYDSDQLKGLIDFLE